MPSSQATVSPQKPQQASGAAMQMAGGPRVRRWARRTGERTARQGRQCCRVPTCWCWEEIWPTPTPATKPTSADSSGTAILTPRPWAEPCAAQTHCIACGPLAPQMDLSVAYRLWVTGCLHGSALRRQLQACDDEELLRSPFEAALPPPSHVQPGRLVVQKPDLPRHPQADRGTATSDASPYTTRAADRCCRSAVCMHACGRACRCCFAANYHMPHVSHLCDVMPLMQRWGTGGA